MNIRPWAILVSLFMTGCINPAVSSVRDTKITQTVSAPDLPQKIEQQKKEPDAYQHTDSGRKYSLTLKNADIKDVLMLLSKESGVPIVAERGISGLVKIEAQNRKLGELLYAVLKPLGYTASVENGMILVGRPQLSTRIFRVNYIKDKRNSSSNTNVSGFAAGGSSGSVNVSTEGKSDFWGAIESSLEMLVFGTSGMGKRESGSYIRGEAEKKVVGEHTATGTTQSSGGSSSQGGYARQSSSNMTSRSTIQNTEVDDVMLQNSQISQNQLKQLVVNETAGIIMVTDFTENLDKIASFLADVEEGSKRQVLIQAHILEVNLRDAFSLGINWNTVISSGTAFSLTQGVVGAAAIANSSGFFKFDAKGKDVEVFIDALKDQGNVNMLSSPKISALNNQKAVIKLTTKQVSWIRTQTTIVSSTSTLDTTYQPQIDEVGIFLDVTPQIAADGKITMQVHPSVSEVIKISSPNNDPVLGSKPIINVREIDTMVEAKNGETIVIAGLISDKLNETKSSIPLLGDIPYLGALFSKSVSDRSKSELVIMLTPYVLNSKNVAEIRAEHEKRMRDMGGSFYLINNLGSLVTEKPSRDWLMQTNRALIPTGTQPFEQSEKENRAPVTPTNP